MSLSDRHRGGDRNSGDQDDFLSARAPDGLPAAGARQHPVLQVRGLTKRFGGLLAVSAVDFDIPHGKVISIVGPNGAGKTTLFNLISGVVEPDRGAVSFEGRN